VRVEVRKPDSLWGWLALIPLVMLGMILMLFGLALAILLLLVSPILVWWQRRKGPTARAPQDHEAIGKVIDVDYTVKEERAE